MFGGVPKRQMPDGRVDVWRRTALALDICPLAPRIQRKRKRAHERARRAKRFFGAFPPLFFCFFFFVLVFVSRRRCWVRLRREGSGAHQGPRPSLNSSTGGAP